jgi:peptidoglycan hydrolase-like protein with peptidoglycan-binding domain
MHNAMMRASREKSGPLDGRHAIRVLSGLGWRARDAAGVLLGALLTMTVLINVLFMQSGSHPAPMFKSTSAQMKPAMATDSTSIPRSRPIEPAGPAASTKSPSAPRPPGEIINDIQHELARRGYYDGIVDGLYGPKTDAAIRDFEQAAALKPSAEPSEALLQAIMRAPAKLVKGATAATPGARPMPIRADGVSGRLVPSKRVIALQRALAEYGYGQIRASGIIDAETQAAIEKFERERKLPITGQASDLVMRELAAMTGRPLE